MRKFSKNIITHQSTKQTPFILDFFKTLFFISMFILAVVGAYALIKPQTQEFLSDDFAMWLEKAVSWLGL